MDFKRLTLLVLTFCTILSVKSQNYSRLASVNNSPELDSIFAQADSLKSYMEFDLADQLYSTIIKNNSSNPNIKIYGQLASIDNLLRHKKTDIAKSELLSLEKSNTSLLDSFNIDCKFLWAQYFYQKRQFDSSAIIYEELNQELKTKVVNPLFYGEFLNAYGELKLHALNDAKYSLLFFKRAVDIWETEQKDKDHYSLGRFYYNLGYLYSLRTEYSLLLLYGKKALAISKIFSKQYPRLEFVCYYLIAEAQSSLGNFDKAIEITKYSLEFAKDQKLKEYLIDYTYNNLAEFAMNADYVEDAYNYNHILLNRLIVGIEMKESTKSSLYPIALRRHALCLEQLNKINEAQEFHLKSLKTNADKYGLKSRRYGQALRYYSEFLSNQNKYEEAIEFIDSSIITYEYKWVKHNDESHLYGLILGYYSKGLIYNQIDSKASKTALNSFMNAAYYMDSLRAQYFIDETELDFSSTIKPVFENIISTSIGLFNETNDSSYLDDVYYAIESNKYQTLWQKIKEKDYFEIESVSQKTLDSLISIEKSIETLNKAINESSEESIELKLELVKLKEAKAQLTNKEISNQSTKQNLQINYLQNTLDKNEILIELFEGENILFGLIIQKNKVNCFQFNLTDEYLQNIVSLKNILAGYELSKPLKLQVEEFVSLASFVSEPFNVALRNANINKEDKKSIIIVPDGRFRSIPFETFIYKTESLNDKSSFVELPYWIQYHNIHYSISAKWFIEENINETTSSYNSITAIGPKRSAILLGAEKEIDEIGLKFGKQSQCIIQNQRNFLKQSEFSNSILHIASHAVIDSISSNQSYLHFGSEKEDSLKLFDYEISNLNIRLPLIVLNACETFKGKEYKGEGIYNLNQSFIIGGAESVISTLWKIEDNSASIFMNKFYTLIKKGNPINECVNQTKRSMIQKDRNSHPFYWAAYLYNGETKAKFKKNNQSIKFILIGFLAFLISIIAIKLRSKQPN